jgi:hypothetical protein
MAGEIRRNYFQKSVYQIQPISNSTALFQGTLLFAIGTSPFVLLFTHPSSVSKTQSLTAVRRDNATNGKFEFRPSIRVEKNVSEKVGTGYFRSIIELEDGINRKKGQRIL